MTEKYQPASDGNKEVITVRKNKNALVKIIEKMLYKAFCTFFVQKLPCHLNDNVII